MELNVKNLSKTLLTQDIGLTETSFKVADAGALPNPPFLITVEGEIMRVGSKNISTNTLSNVLRGREGTSPAPHSSGTVVENRFTAGTYDEIKQTVTSYNDALTSHLADDASTTTKGHVQLSSSTSSTSTSLAATASAVKTVNDALTSHLAENVSQSGGVHGLDIEAGVWTPRFGPGNHTHSEQEGKYVRIGKLVHVSGKLQLSAKDEEATGNLIIGSLPFVSNFNAAVTIGNFNHLSFGPTPAGVLYGATAGRNIALYHATDNSWGENMQVDKLTYRTSMRFSATYTIG